MTVVLPIQEHVRRGAAARAGVDQSVPVVQANVSYEFLAAQDEGGAFLPIELGQGKFAKVLKGMQRSAGREVRPVAIKVLHDYASIAHERLFRQEIELLKEMASDSGVNVVSTLDILYIPPMVMCGCGKIYHPACPQGCDVLLARRESPEDKFPQLFCSGCGYELSGRFVTERGGELLRYPAKRCCQRGPTALSGRILNFVDREAVVMELLEMSLVDFVGRRRAELQATCARYKQQLAESKGRAQRGDPWPRRLKTWFDDLFQQDRIDVLATKTILLEKVRLMVELAESVAWLHGRKNIVHKDLAPDNIMVSFVRSEAVDQELERSRALKDLLDDLVSSPRFHVRIIDFGLSDKNELTRSWYEEEVSGGCIKHPFLSPEARVNRLRVNQQLEIEPGLRFRIPKMLASSLLETDIVADVRDQDHNHDLEVTRLERNPDTGELYAYFKGDPSPNLKNQQFELVRRLGEPHDLYAVGALFYFILTERQDEVDALSGYANSLYDVPIQLTARALAADTRYVKRRDAIPEKFWQDELMVLILRAMVRGRAGSLKASRIDRGPMAAQQLLRETKRIYHGIQQEILAAPRLGPLRRFALFATLIAALFFTSALLSIAAALVARYRL
jgi:serine/threonine protein kinase